MVAKLQLALDFLSIHDALPILNKVSDYFDFIEAGTPLVKAEGMGVVKLLKSMFPDKVIVADLKTMDAGALETKLAIDNGADLVSILGVSSETTIKESIQVAHEHKKLLQVDLIGHSNKLKRAEEVLEMGADFVLFHAGLDEQSEGKNIIEELSSKLPPEKIAFAGGLKPETIQPLVDAKIGLLIIGGAVIRHENPLKQSKLLKEAIMK